MTTADHALSNISRCESEYDRLVSEVDGFVDGIERFCKESRLDDELRARMWGVVVNGIEKCAQGPYDEHEYTGDLVGAAIRAREQYPNVLRGLQSTLGTPAPLSPDPRARVIEAYAGPPSAAPATAAPAVPQAQTADLKQEPRPGILSRCGQYFRQFADPRVLGRALLYGGLPLGLGSLAFTAARGGAQRPYFRNLILSALLGTALQPLISGLLPRRAASPAAPAEGGGTVLAGAPAAGAGA